jgi:hypothetical protein
MIEVNRIKRELSEGLQREQILQEGGMAGMSARLLAEAPGLAAPIGAGLSAARAVNALRGFVVGGSSVGPHTRRFMRARKTMRKRLVILSELSRC